MILSSTGTFLLVIITLATAVDLAPPKFNGTVKNVTVSVGETAILPCTVKSLGEFKVVWMNPNEKTLTYEERRIIEDERVSVERPYLKEWNLHVREVEMKDSGIYLCQINTRPVQMKPVQLIVQQPPAIIGRLSSPEEVKVTEGETVQLVCNVTGFPTPEVTWYRIPKGSLRENDGETSNIGKGEVLMIHNVSRYCDDDYECVAFNGVKPADKRRMRVRVQFIPEIRLPNKKIGQQLGKYTILECQVIAFPLSITAWRRQGKDIGNDEKFRTEVYNEAENKVTISLNIQALNPSDFGDYECYSENFLGHDSEIMTLYEYVKQTTPRTTTTTTTTTTTPWWRDRHHDNNGYNTGGDGRDLDYNQHNRGTHGDGGGIGANSYNYNNGRESQLHLRKNSHNSRDDGDNDNRDGSVQPVISGPESSSPGGVRGAVNVILLTALSSILFVLMR